MSREVSHETWKPVLVVKEVKPFSIQLRAHGGGEFSAPCLPYSVKLGSLVGMPDDPEDTEGLTIKADEISCEDGQRFMIFRDTLTRVGGETLYGLRWGRETPKGAVMVDNKLRWFLQDGRELRLSLLNFDGEVGSSAPELIDPTAADFVPPSNPAWSVEVRKLRAGHVLTWACRSEVVTDHTRHQNVKVLSFGGACLPVQRPHGHEWERWGEYDQLQPLSREQWTELVGLLTGIFFEEAHELTGNFDLEVVRSLLKRS